MSESFATAVKEQLVRDKSTLIVDNAHSYAKIEKRVRALWDAVCLLPEGSLSEDNLLFLYAGIASMAQHAAESLNVAATQQIVEPTQDEKDVTITGLRKLLATVWRECRLVPSYQLGDNRYGFEFDEAMLQTIISEVKKL